MMVQMQTQLEIAHKMHPVDVEVSVVPEKALLPGSRYSPTCGIIRIYDLERHHFLESISREMERKLIDEAIEEAKKSPYIQKLIHKETAVAAHQ